MLLLLIATASAGTTADAYLDLEASITAPDAASAGETFTLEVAGENLIGSDFSVFSYAVYRDADWSYSAAHMVEVASGETLDASGFEWGYLFDAAYEIEADGGEHTYTFVLGYRDGAHDWYDLAVELTVGGCSLDTAAMLELLDSIDDADLRSPGSVHRNALELKLDGAQTVIDAGAYRLALDTLADDVRPRLTGADEPPWITDEGARLELLALLNELTVCLHDSL